MLEAGGARVRWMPDSLSPDDEEEPRPSARKPWARLADGLFGTVDPAFLGRTLRAIDEEAIQMVVAYWGTGPLSDIVALKRARPAVKVVLMMLCYPLAFTTGGILRQRLRMARAAGSLDGVLCPSRGMVDYLSAHDLAGRECPMIVLPPCWPASFRAARRDPLAPNRRVVYVGRPDFTSRTATGADDVRLLLDGLLEAGVEVHHGEARALGDGHPGRRMFPPTPLRSLIALMGGFDASLVAYNDAACARRERLVLTVPDRLITSVAAGIPVALPATGYDASRHYLADYPAIIEYRSARELADRLGDRDHVARLRDEAWLARGRYAAERHGEALRDFLHAVVVGGRPAPA